MSWFRRLFVGLTLRKPGFDSGRVGVRFVVKEVTLGHVFLRVHWFHRVSIIPPKGTVLALFVWLIDISKPSVLEKSLFL